MREFFQELLNASTEQVYVLVALLKEQLCSSGSLPLIIHVDNDQLIQLIFEAEQFRNKLVAANVRSRVAHCFFNSPHYIFIRVSQVKEQEFGILSDTEHLSGVSDG